MKEFLSHVKYILALFFLLILIVIVNIKAYERYSAEILLQEQQQLLLMAETVGQSLENYINSEIDKIDLFFSGKTKMDDLEKSIDFFLAKNNDVFLGALIANDRGKILFSAFINNQSKKLFDVSSQYNNAAKIISKNLSKNGYYEMSIRKQIFIDAEIVNIFFYVDLQKIYLKIVAPIKIGRAGYSVVKDKDLAIIITTQKIKLEWTRYMTVQRTILI